MFKSAEEILDQIKAKKWVDVLAGPALRPDHIHHKHFQSIASGAREEHHYIEVRTYLSGYLLPIAFATEEEARAFLLRVHEAYTHTPPRQCPPERLL